MVRDRLVIAPRRPGSGRLRPAGAPGSPSWRYARLRASRGLPIRRPSPPVVRLDPPEREAVRSVACSPTSTPSRMRAPSLDRGRRRELLEGYSFAPPNPSPSRVARLAGRKIPRGGPFSSLENRWSFEPREQGACEVTFFIAYEFKSRMLAMLMGSMFDAAFGRFALAFEKRADQIYGKPQLST